MINIIVSSCITIGKMFFTFVTSFFIVSLFCFLIFSLFLFIKITHYCIKVNKNCNVIYICRNFYNDFASYWSKFLHSIFFVIHNIINNQRSIMRSFFKFIKFTIKTMWFIFRIYIFFYTIFFIWNIFNRPIREKISDALHNNYRSQNISGKKVKIIRNIINNNIKIKIIVDRKNLTQITNLISNMNVKILFLKWNNYDDNVIINIYNLNITEKRNILSKIKNVVDKSKIIKKNYKRYIIFI